MTTVNTLHSINSNNLEMCLQSVVIISRTYLLANVKIRGPVREIFESICRACQTIDPATDILLMGRHTSGSLNNISDTSGGIRHVSKEMWSGATLKLTSMCRYSSD